MARIYDVQSLVELPKVTANAAATIGTKIGAAAAVETKLPPGVVIARDRVERATGGLHEAIRGSFQPAPDPSHLPESRDEAATWSGIESWLIGLARVPTAKAAVAQQLLDALFGDGLAFLRLPTPDRWAQTEGRLAHVDKAKLDGEFARLGGADLLAMLRKTHAAAGDAAGITTPRPSLPAVVGAALDAWKAAAKSWVVQVVAAADLDGTAAGAALAARLLAPLTTHEPARAAKPGEPGTPPGETGTPPGGAGTPADAAGATAGAKG